MKKKAISQAMDINDARFYYPNDVKSYSCDYEGLYECDIIVLTSGGIPETSDRLDELKTNKKSCESIYKKNC